MHSFTAGVSVVISDASRHILDLFGFYSIVDRRSTCFDWRGGDQAGEVREPSQGYGEDIDAAVDR